MDGSQEIDTPEARARLESLFPNLAKSGYQITSPQNSKYNCIAYAVGDLNRWWNGRIDGNLKTFGFYWPPDAKHGTKIDELIYAYEACGYASCNDDSSLEEGYTKVAVYMNSNGGWSHAALQLPNGSWSSKIGPYEDIRHNSPHAFEGSPDYGTVYCYMKRPIKNSGHDPSEDSDSIDAME